MQLRCISWRWVPYPGELETLSPELLNDRTLQMVDDIMVTTGGLTHLASLRPTGPGVQITMSGGQVVFGNVQQIDIAFLLRAAEGALDAIDASDETKAEARGVLRKMSEAAMTVGSTAAGSVVAAAVRHVLGLP